MIFIALLTYILKISESSIFEENSPRVDFGGILNVSVKLEFYEKLYKSITKSIIGIYTHLPDGDICHSYGDYSIEYMGYYAGHILSCKRNELVLFNLNSMCLNGHEIIFTIKSEEYKTKPITISALLDKNYQKIYRGISNYYTRISTESRKIIYLVYEKLLESYSLRLFVCLKKLNEFNCQTDERVSKILRVKIDDISVMYSKNRIIIEGDLSHLTHYTVGIQVSNNLVSHERYVIAKSSFLLSSYISFNHCTPTYIALNIPKYIGCIDIFVSAADSNLNYPDLSGFPRKDFYYAPIQKYFSEFVDSKAYFSSEKFPRYDLLIFVTIKDNIPFKMLYDCFIPIDYRECVEINKTTTVENSDKEDAISNDASNQDNSSSKKVTKTSHQSISLNEGALDTIYQINFTKISNIITDSSTLFISKEVTVEVTKKLYLYMIVLITIILALCTSIILVVILMKFKRTRYRNNIYQYARFIAKSISIENE